MPIFPLNRRFAYLWEFDRRGTPVCGTREQQETILESWRDIAPYDSKLDLALRKLAQVVKAKGPKYANVEFLPDIPFGHASWVGVRLNVDITGDILVGTFWHELGHTLGINFWSDSSEDWAHQFASWALGMQDENHWVWQRIQQYLTGT